VSDNDAGQGGDPLCSPGRPHPLGATPEPGGVNFSVFSRDARTVELVLYDHVDDDEPSDVIAMEPRRNRTNHYWHVFVPSLGPGAIYGYRADGPHEPQRGLRFDADKVLLDPYGRAVAVPTHYDRIAASQPGRNDATTFKSVVADTDAYDWEGDAPLHRPFSQTVIYELHVRGFTMHPNSGVDKARRGTYAGLVDKIPYLQSLGITAVELLPVFQFDWLDAPKGRVNFWGYSPLSFFAPHHGYSSRNDPLGPLDEFRDMVKALHRAGIEVIVDVVYNHTAEGDHRGPNLSFRGLANNVYYILEQGGARYANYSGTGNTLNANRSVVRRLIMDSLRYWVQEMHVDGFRFDLASILTRDNEGRPLATPPLLWDIDSDPVLAGTKLIAEAWDAAGLYQVGSFVGDFWKEWNGKFRDDVRAFVRGDNGKVPLLFDRLVGSPDLYGAKMREPEQSINFVTCHDGFTVNDLVSYREKHNCANGEDNRDGHNHNLSCNYGVEGPTDDPEVERTRNRQVKNLLAITMLSLGAPMLLMGDEVRRTQKGNNNAYCQDNATSWFDWSLLERHPDILRFVTGLIRFRFLRDAAAGDSRLSLAELRRRANIEYHGVRLGHPDLQYHSHSLALSATNLLGTMHMYFALSAYWEPLEFELPPWPAKGSPWRRVIDTSFDAPNDIVDVHCAPVVAAQCYPVGPRSVVGLVADGVGKPKRPPRPARPYPSRRRSRREGPPQG
jgi:isoamylase